MSLPMACWTQVGPWDNKLARGEAKVQVFGWEIPSDFPGRLHLHLKKSQSKPSSISGLEEVASWKRTEFV